VTTRLERDGARDVPVGLPSVQEKGEWQPRVIGLDLSLTSTGIAGADWAMAARPGKRRSHDRMDWLLGAVSVCVNHELAGLWWLVTQYLWRHRIPYAVANPHHRTIYATGCANPAQGHPRKERSRVAKGMVRAVAVERYGVECDGPGRYDQADATILAAMGLDWLGYPTVPVPDTHRRTLEAVRWPVLIPAAAN
jgi:hypothetical protein